jgi:hypothetical protein
MYSPHRDHLYTSISPGRFFAANEVKALLAHILVTYDFKVEEGKRAPRIRTIGSMRVPEKANVMFRKRQK